MSVAAKHAAKRAVNRAVAGLGALLPALALVVLAGCGGAARAKRGVDRNDAIIRIAADVSDAELWVNDRFVGHVRSLRGGIALSPGSHRIELRHDRYHTHYEILRVEARERRTLTVDMAEILP